MSINIDQLNNDFDGDKEMIRALLEVFESSYTEHLEKLESSILRKDFENIKLHAHTLKGMCSNFFAEKAVELSLYIEIQGREANDAADLDDKLKELKMAIYEAVVELKKI